MTNDIQQQKIYGVVVTAVGDMDEAEYVTFLLPMLDRLPIGNDEEVVRLAGTPIGSASAPRDEAEEVNLARGALFDADPKLIVRALVSALKMKHEGVDSHLYVAGRYLVTVNRWNLENDEDLSVPQFWRVENPPAAPQ
ncbi:hypothetical protein ACWEPH_21690 [Nocardia beijingensis]